MKIQKIFTIDVGLIEKLSKVDNMSFLVNKLLHKHFNEIDNMTPEELDKEIVRLEIIKKANEKLQKEGFKPIPEVIDGE